MFFITIMSIGTKIIREKESGMKKSSFIIGLLLLCSVTIFSGGMITIEYLTPTVNRLRFRDAPSLQGTFIRFLDLNEKLRLLEVGKRETIGDATGNWVQVISEKRDVGWCFDAYLKKIEVEADYRIRDKVFENNVSKIYFYTNEANNANHTIIGDRYTLEGVVMPNAESLEITYNSTLIYKVTFDDIDNLHKYFVPVSIKGTTMQYRQNTYIISIFKGRERFQREFILTAISKESKTVRANESSLFKMEKRSSNDSTIYELYVYQGSDEWSRIYDFNKYYLPLNKSESIEFQIKYNEKKNLVDDMPLVFIYRNTNKNVKLVKTLKPYMFAMGMGGGVVLEELSNGDYILTPAVMHEAPPDPLYINVEKGFIFSIHELLGMLFNGEYYAFFGMVVSGNTITITEHQSPWDDPNQRDPMVIAIDKNTKKIISKKPAH